MFVQEKSYWCDYGVGGGGWGDSMTLALGDCQHVHHTGLICPENHPPSQTTTKKERKVHVGGVVLGALQPCMRANTHMNSLREHMDRSPTHHQFELRFSLGCYLRKILVVQS